MLTLGLLFIPGSSDQNAEPLPNAPYLADNDVPYRGDPGSHVVSPDGTKERVYGPNGLPQKDRHHTDHGNPKEHPNVPHDHDWGQTGEGKWEPGPGYASPPGPLTTADFSWKKPSFKFPAPNTGDSSFAGTVIGFFISVFEQGRFK